MDKIEERCKTVMAEIMNVSTSALTGDINPITLAEWDSLTNVQLILALEKEFGISIPPEDGIEYVTSLDNIVFYVRNAAQKDES